MDVQALATAAMAILSPYLAQAGEAFAKKAGEKLAEKAGAVYQAIKEKFKGDSYAEETLARVEEKPESEGRQAALKEVLAEKLGEDADFAEVVGRLLAEAQAADTRKVIASGERSVAAGGSANASAIATGEGSAAASGGSTITTGDGRKSPKRS